MATRIRARQAGVTRPRASRRASPREITVPPRNDFPVVAVGASAGGLEAVSKLLDAVPADSGMAFIVIQHLDPTHESMMVDLLGGHTTMKVRQVVDAMPLERGHVYVIPPQSYLSIRDGSLHLSSPRERRGARMPFDFFLRSLAGECGRRAICVVLSGTGADGSLGLTAIRENGGLIIVQDPLEAAYDGMPRSAITTGAADLVLPVAKIPEALAERGRQLQLKAGSKGSVPADKAPDALAQVIDLLGVQASHKFSLYKPGTLLRRLERRMALTATADIDRYLQLLRSDLRERELLAKDLLIHVTSFFRDPKAFDLLAKKVVPDLVRAADLRPHAPCVGSGLQHGRGGLFHRHAVPRGDRGGQAEHPAAGLCLRHRRRCGRLRPRRSLPRHDPGGCDRRSGWPGSSSGKTTTIGYRRRCARPSSSRCRTFSRMCRFRASISSPAGIS